MDMNIRKPQVPKALKRRKGKAFSLVSFLVHAGIGFGCVWFLTWQSIPGYILAIISISLEVAYQFLESSEIKDFSYREVGEVMVGVVTGGVVFKLAGKL